MAFFHGPSERARQERDTPERILQIARTKGEFRVSLRYRDDWLRKRLTKMTRQGLLVGGKRIGSELVYRPAPAAIQDAEAAAAMRGTIDPPAPA